MSERSTVPPAQPVDVTVVNSGVSQSYWAQTRAYFFRNKLAVLSLIIVVLIGIVGIFAPVLANKRPLYINMVFEDEYDEHYFIVLNIWDTWVEGNTSRTPEEKLRIAETSLSEMRLSLAENLREEFDAVSQKVIAQLRSGDLESDSAVEVLEAFESGYDVSAVELIARERYPLFFTLSYFERFFMIWFISQLVILALGVPFGLGFRSMVMSAVIFSSVTTFLTYVPFPYRQDEFNYRLVISAPDFETNGGRVIRTPIPFGENENITQESRQPPTWMLAKEKWVEGQNYHLLGTDTNGRDVLTRMIYGARISMLIGIIAVSFYVAVGIVLGAIAGFFRGWTDMALSRIIEVVICFPVLFLILSVQAFLQPSIFNIILAMGLVSWTGVARLERGEFLRLVNQEFVLSARSLGASNFRLIFRHILPNALGPILVLTSFGIAGSILVESTLSFLGFGVPQPMASWGDLLNNGRNDIQGTWWLTVFPGLAIFVTVTCFNLIGEGVRDALDPRRDAG